MPRRSLPSWASITVTRQLLNCLEDVNAREVPTPFSDQCHPPAGPCRAIHCHRPARRKAVRGAVVHADGARHADVHARILRGEANAVVTRQDIERRAPVRLSQMLRGLPGLRVVDSAGAFVAISSRGTKVEDGPDGLAPAPCVMRVMVDGILSSASRDIDQLLPVDVYAIEIFYGSTRMPLQYAGMRNVNLCGLIAIWTR